MYARAYVGFLCVCVCVSVTNLLQEKSSYTMHEIGKSRLVALSRGYAAPSEYLYTMTALIRDIFRRYCFLA